MAPSAPPSLDDRERAEQALLRLGFDWDRLEKLSRRALKLQLARKNITLDDGRYQEALDFIVEIAVRWALKYDPELARGQSFPTSCFRQLTDRDRTLSEFLRRRHGDARRGVPIHDTVTVDGTLPENVLEAQETFDTALARIVAEISDRLPSSVRRRVEWTLRRLVLPMAEQDLTLDEAARHAGVDYTEAEELLEEIEWRLPGRARRTPKPALSIADFALMGMAAA